MEEKILRAETHLASSRTALADPSVASDAAALHARCEALDSAQADVVRLYDRWAELEEKQSDSAGAP